MLSKLKLYCASVAVILLFGGIATAQKRPASQSARITITRMGFEPAALRLKRGVRARVSFLRTTDDTCATEVIFPDYGITRTLPLNQTITITFTPARAGEFAFTCGMNMHRGRLIVQ